MNYSEGLAVQYKLGDASVTYTKEAEGGLTTEKFFEEILEAYNRFTFKNAVTIQIHGSWNFETNKPQVIELTINPIDSGAISIKHVEVNDVSDEQEGTKATGSSAGSKTLTFAGTSTGRTSGRGPCNGHDGAA